jgi:hypothetical protein
MMPETTSYLVHVKLQKPHKEPPKKEKGHHWLENILQAFLSCICLCKHEGKLDHLIKFKDDIDVAALLLSSSSGKPENGLAAVHTWPCYLLPSFLCLAVVVHTSPYQSRVVCTMCTCSYVFFQGGVDGTRTCPEHGIVPVTPSHLSQRIMLVP